MTIDQQPRDTAPVLMGQRSILTPSGPGVFIPLDINGGPNMRDLHAFLIQHPIFGWAEGLPRKYLRKTFLERFAESRSHLQHALRNNDMAPILREFLASHGAHAGRKPQGTAPERDKSRRRRQSAQARRFLPSRVLRARIHKQPDTRTRQSPPGEQVFIKIAEDGEITISEPRGAISPEDARLLRGLRLLNVGRLILKWMSQDIGENSPGFVEKYTARCREMSKTLQTIFPELNERHN